MMEDQLERCQKALSDFLEEKRSRMPRFYFIGDDDLLEILGQATNPRVIQAHLKNCFQGIHKVGFYEGEKMQVTKLISVAGECVDLYTPVKITPEVEEWCVISKSLLPQLFACSSLLCVVITDNHT